MNSSASIDTRGTDTMLMRCRCCGEVAEGEVGFALGYGHAAFLPGFAGSVHVSARLLCEEVLILAMPDSGTGVIHDHLAVNRASPRCWLGGSAIPDGLPEGNGIVKPVLADKRGEHLTLVMDRWADGDESSKQPLCISRSMLAQIALPKGEKDVLNGSSPGLRGAFIQKGKGTLVGTDRFGSVGCSPHLERLAFENESIRVGRLKGEHLIALANDESNHLILGGFFPKDPLGFGRQPSIPGVTHRDREHENGVIYALSIAERSSDFWGPLGMRHSDSPSFPLTYHAQGSRSIWAMAA